MSISILKLLTILQEKNIPFKVKQFVCYFSYKGIDYYFSKGHCYRIKDLTLIDIKELFHEDTTTL